MQSFSKNAKSVMTVLNLCFWLPCLLIKRLTYSNIAPKLIFFRHTPTLFGCQNFDMRNSITHFEKFWKVLADQKDTDLSKLWLQRVSANQLPNIEISQAKTSRDWKMKNALTTKRGRGSPPCDILRGWYTLFLFYFLCRSSVFA